MDVILDTETTGLKDHDQIIEISIINAGFGVDNWPAGAFPLPHVGNVIILLTRPAMKPQGTGGPVKPISCGKKSGQG